MSSVAKAPSSAITPAIMVCLAIVYVVWGSTYFGIKVAIQSLPPLGMLGVRFLVAGLILLAIELVRGAKLPTALEWRNSAIVGLLLLGGGTGFVTLAERDASSSVAAMMIAVSPLFATIFARFWGEKTHMREWLGIGVGLLGIALLNVGELHATPLAALLLLLAPLCWTFGSQWSRHVALPPGLMGSAAEMVTGGGLILALSFVFREHWSTPTQASLWALIYLIVFGSLVAYSA